MEERVFKKGENHRYTVKRKGKDKTGNGGLGEQYLKEKEGRKEKKCRVEN